MTAASSVIREQTSMTGFSVLSAVLVRTTANVVFGGVVFCDPCDKGLASLSERGV